MSKKLNNYLTKKAKQLAEQITKLIVTIFVLFSFRLIVNISKITLTFIVFTFLFFLIF